MGRFDDLTADLQPSSTGTGGRFDDLVGDLSPPNVSHQIPDGLKSALSKIPGLAQKLSPMIPGIEPLTTMAEMKPIGQQIHAGFPEVAGDIAENMGSRGYGPRTSALVTTPIAMAPEIASAGMGLGELVAGGSPVARAIRTTPKNIGAEMGVGEEAAGISKNLPVRRGTMFKFPDLAGLPSNSPPAQAPTVTPIVYPKDTATFLNVARARLEGLGKQLTPQELSDYRSILSDMFNKGEVAPGTKTYAMASQLRSLANDLFEQAVPGRADLNNVYSLSSKMRNPSQLLPQSIVQGTKKIAPVLEKGAAIGAGYGLVKKLLGN